MVERKKIWIPFDISYKEKRKLMLPIEKATYIADNGANLRIDGVFKYENKTIKFEAMFYKKSASYENIRSRLKGKRTVRAIIPSYYTYATYDLNSAKGIWLSTRNIHIFPTSEGSNYEIKIYDPRVLK